MRKQFITFLILVFVLGLAPVNFSVAITQNQIDAEVQIVCTDGSDNWFSGSGTIIDPKGIILTNRHVVEGAYMNTCFIGFIESISQEPNFGTSGNYNLAEVKYQTASNDMDAAILYLENPTNKTYPYINIWDSNSDALQFGDKIEVIGFPSIGGSTITYTSGDFSGFGSSSDGTQNYIKSTAPLEHGNSGGASYNPSGQFIGIPTMVVAGTLNSMSYVLSVNSIKGWLGGVLGSGYQQEVIEQEPVVEEPIVSIQNDITPPEMKNYNIKYRIINDSNLQESKIQYYWDSSSVVDKNRVAKYFYYYGNDLTADPVKDGKSFISINGTNYIPEIFTIDSIKEKYLMIKIQDNKGNISSPIVSPWSIKEIIIRGYLFNIYNESKNSFDYEDQNVFKKYSGYFVKNSGLIWYINPKNNKKHIVKGLFIYDDYYTYDYYAFRFSGIFSNRDIGTGITSNNLVKKPQHVWGHLLSEVLDDGVSMGGFYYIHPKTGKLYDFSGLTSGKDSKIMELIESLAIEISEDDLDKINTNPISSYYVEEEMIPIYIDKFIPQEIDEKLSKRLNGLILLQVESNGEAFYVYPDNKRRYYLGRPTDAFNAMRELGLGATHQFINSYTIYPDHVLGKILIDVEQNGEAYYIYPKDKKAYYLGRPADAFRIMRELGLGITNNDLSKISEGSM